MATPPPQIPPTPKTTGLLAGLRGYGRQLERFQPNARLYLLNIVFAGLAMGIYRLLFNFFVLAAGFNEALLGGLLTISSLVSLIFALPAGVLSDKLGRKPSLLIGNLIATLAIFGMVLWPNALGLYSMNVLLGLAQSLLGVTSGPFLMENSGDEERTYLFSFTQGIQMTAVFVGNWFGGRMPAWIAEWRGFDPASLSAYGWTIGVVAAIFALSLLPLLFIRRRYPPADEEPMLSPIQYARQNPRLLGKLVAPMLITSLGAGLLMPFMNIFFRNVHGSSDATIGTLFAWGSLAMGAGLLIAPPLADRWGKVRLVVITQGLSIPFLVLLGFVPWYGISAFAYLVRLTLMNMSGPIYQAFVMEHVDREGRATVASLVSMSWNLGWAFSPTLSGWLQVRFGFAPVFLGTISAYAIAVFLYWRFFLYREQEQPTERLSIPHSVPKRAE